MSTAADMSCPACGAELDLAVLFSHQADARALERLVDQGFPLGTLVLRYINLHKPAKQALTARKKIKLLLDLLPDLERGAITRAGRDWVAPKAVWAQAIDKLVTDATNGAVDLPLRGHGLLHSVIQRLADQQEAAQERQSEQDRRTSRAQQPTVTVRGQPMAMGDALQAVYGGRDPALVALDASSRNAAPIPDDIRQRMAELRGAKKPGAST